MITDLGKPVERFGASRSMQIVWILLGLLFVGAGVLLQRVQADAAAGRVQFVGNPAVLVQAELACYVLGGFIVVLTIVWALTRPTIRIHEHGISVTRRGSRRQHLFSEIRDIYDPPVGPYFAYRSDERDPWVYISTKTSHIGRLRRRLTEGQIAHRLPLIGHALEAGETVDFWTLPAKSELLKSWTAMTRHLGDARPTIKVNRGGLTVDSAWYPITESLELKLNPYTHTLTIADARGTLLTTPAAALLSTALVESCIRALQSAKTA